MLQVSVMTFLLLIFTACANDPNIRIPMFKTVPQSQQKKSNYYKNDAGLKMYYEDQGSGRPIVLLHGSFMSIDMNWKELKPALIKSRRVIAVELQGHGRTADITRPYSYKTLSDDIAGLLKQLRIKRADILGYSFGGTVALQMAISHPDMVNKLVIVSSVYKYDGWINDAQKSFPTMRPDFFEKTPLKAEYNRLAPDKTQWDTWMSKMIEFNGTPFDLGIRNIANIKTPVLIINGDNDGVNLAHIKEMYGAVGGGVFSDVKGLPRSQLAIFPATTHVGLITMTDKLLEILIPFLDKKED